MSITSSSGFRDMPNRRMARRAVKGPSIALHIAGRASDSDLIHAYTRRVSADQPRIQGTGIPNANRTQQQLFQNSHTGEIRSLSVSSGVTSHESGPAQSSRRLGTAGRRMSGHAQVAPSPKIGKAAHVAHLSARQQMSGSWCPSCQDGRVRLGERRRAG